MKTTHVRFDKMERAPRRKTDRWRVFNVRGVYLGAIGWQPGWRCYVFAPSGMTIYSSDCMHDIATFVFNRTHEHKWPSLPVVYATRSG